MTDQETTADVVVEDEMAPEAAPEVEVDGRDYRVEGNDISGYVGVDPEYMTYANETDRPLNTALEQWDLGLLDHLEGNMDDEKKADETDAETAETPEDDKSDQTPAEAPAAHNAPVSVPGVITPTL